MNIPNKLTFARVCMIPAFVVVLIIGMSAGFALSLYNARLIATGIFILASITDGLDGYLARKLNQTTDFGKFMDPLADKILVMSAMVYLVVLGEMSPWILILIESREFVIAGVRMVAANKNIVIAASFWGKLKTVVQMIMIPTVLANTQFEAFDRFTNFVGQILMYAAVALAVISALDYIRKNWKVFQEEVKH